MGSDSDLPIMREAARVLNEFEVSYEVKIISAHRTPFEMVEYSQTAQSRGIKVIISGAGGSAHLPGMVASDDIYTRNRSAYQQFFQSPQWNRFALFHNPNAPRCACCNSSN